MEHRGGGRRGSWYLVIQEHSQETLSPQVKFSIRRGAHKDTQKIDHTDYLLVFLEEKLGGASRRVKTFPFMPLYYVKGKYYLC